MRDLRVREGVKVVNLMAVADLARDVAGLRDAGGNYRSWLDDWATRFRSEIRAWIGDRSPDPRLAEFLDSFVHRGDKQQADALQKTLDRGQVPERDREAIWAAYERCGSDSDKRVFVDNVFIPSGPAEVAMGSGDADPEAEWTALAGTSAGFEEFEELAGPLIRGGPPPAVGVPAIARAPMVIDTDIGGDPDDTVALVVAARLVPELRLVVTSDEYGGERARFARYLLDLVGRTDVRVVAGSDLGNSRMWVIDGLCPAEVPRQGTDVAGAVSELCAATDGRIRWVGMGPLSNLAMLQEERPELVSQLVVTQMGGAINYRDPSRAEHNFRVDPGAAIRLLPALEPWLPTFVVSDVTFNPAMEITTDSPLYKRWTQSDARPFERVLREHCDRWMAKYPGTMQHDALTLAAAMLWPGVRFVRERVALDPIARMSRSDDGTEIVMSVSADYAAFMSWLDTALS